MVNGNAWKDACKDILVFCPIFELIYESVDDYDVTKKSEAASSSHLARWTPCSCSVQEKLLINEFSNLAMASSPNFALDSYLMFEAIHSIHGKWGVLFSFVA